jgi:hypothetical protein
MYLTATNNIAPKPGTRTATPTIVSTILAISNSLHGRGGPATFLREPVFRTYGSMGRSMGDKGRPHQSGAQPPARDTTPWGRGATGFTPD